MQKKIKVQTGITLNKKNYIFIALSILCFFVGRVSIFHMLNPIAIALLGCLLLSGKKFNLPLVFTFLGFISKVSDFYILKYIICLAILFSANFMLKKTSIKENILIKSIIASLAIFISGIIICILNSFSIYYLMLTLLETSLTFCMFFILDKGIIYLFNHHKVISNEEIISLSILIGAVIYGSSDVFIGSISFTYFFIITLILFVSYIYGSSVSAITTILSTFLLTLSDNFSYDLIIIFTISAILCSLFRQKGKILICLSFSISVYVLSLILNIILIDNLLTFSLLGSVFIFLSIPCPIKSFSSALSAEQTATYTEKIQILASNKLNIYANSFSKLSKTFYNLSDKKSTLDQQDVTNIIDEVASKLCNKCDLRIFCWEKNFFSTYQNTFSMLNNFEKFGELNIDAISKDFINNCVNINQFIEILDKTFEIYKLNLSWKNKVIESRELVGKQLTSISSIISQLSKNLCEDISFKENLEVKIKSSLENTGIPTKNVIISQSEKGKLSVFLKVEPCYIPNKCSKTIIPIVNEILNKKMCRASYECLITKENGQSICSISLIEEQDFRINSYVISTPKKDSKESGDSHCFLSLPNGSYLLALSDGMGSGKYAKAQSTATIELLEDFMQAGFSKKLAISMINSVLFLKSSRESFATLDICNIDLYTGICEFIKIGAVSTFIVHNNIVSIIKSDSLPVGILDSVEPEIRRKKLSPNDIIVMVTDGVIDSTNFIDKEKFIVDFLSKNTSKNPEDIAKTIFEQTKQNYKDNIKDDITILVARLWSGN